MLKIRRFVQGTDEPVWLDVLNAYHRDDEYWRAITLDEFLLEQERPGFDFEGRFIAELDGRPAGIVHAYVDRFRNDGQGYIRFGAVPELRGQGVEQLLMKTVLQELKARGMTTAQAWTESSRVDNTRLFEEFGFERVRVFSLMGMELADMRRGIGENREATIRPVRLDSEDDIKLFDRLDNEAFKEHFNYRPNTLEETRYHLLNNPVLRQRGFFFASLNGEPVGYVVVGVDEEYNLQRNAKIGEVAVIGVLKPYRGTGVGTSLMLHALEEIRKKGMTGAILGVDDYNPTRAMGLYEKVGFKVKKKDLIYQRSL
ncbi:MAG: GNAT family N-acetyltransferase [Dehalococcoidia bacterium]